MVLEKTDCTRAYQLVSGSGVHKIAAWVERWVRTVAYFTFSLKTKVIGFGLFRSYLTINKNKFQSVTIKNPSKVHCIHLRFAWPSGWTINWPVYGVTLSTTDQSSHRAANFVTSLLQVKIPWQRDIDAMCNFRRSAHLGSIIVYRKLTRHTMQRTS